jgi:hypothetical protein
MRKMTGLPRVFACIQAAHLTGDPTVVVTAANTCSGHVPHAQHQAEPVQFRRGGAKKTRKFSGDLMEEPRFGSSSRLMGGEPRKKEVEFRVQNGFELDATRSTAHPAASCESARDTALPRLTEAKSTTITTPLQEGKETTKSLLCEAALALAKAVDGATRTAPVLSA